MPSRNFIEEKVRENPVGRVIVSVLVGLGIASMFRYTCGSDTRCVVLRGPKLEDVSPYVYKLDGKCYAYDATPQKCAFTGASQI